MHHRRRSPAPPGSRPPVAAPAPPGSRPPVAAHAVVVGAGIAGLAAAQALAGHVERVTVIERDDLPERPGPRAGVPESRHIHLLQPGGLAALERLLPGVGAEIRAAGATAVRVPGDLLWLSPAGWIPRHPAPAHHVVLSASRELTEWTIRRRVVESPQVLVRSGLDVCGLAIRDGRVAGVDVRSRRAGTEAPAVTIAADLVVDACGRRSPAPAWLAAAGVEVPGETVIDAGLACASRVLRRGPGDTPGWQAALLEGRPPASPRAGALFPIDRHRWLVTLGGTGPEAPPTDDDGFAAFARGLRSPEIADLLDRVEPLGPVEPVGPHDTRNRRRHYERLVQPVDGFVAVGDALCAPNPTYAQGPSLAVLGAEALDRYLAAHLADHRDLAGVSAGAQRAVARAAEGAWTFATARDRRRPGGRGATDRRGRVAQAFDGAFSRYLDRIVAAATADRVAAAALVDVNGLVRSPSSLLRPGLAWRALARRTVPPGDPPSWDRGRPAEAAMAGG